MPMNSETRAERSVFELEVGMCQVNPSVFVHFTTVNNINAADHFQRPRDDLFNAWVRQDGPRSSHWKSNAAITRAGSIARFERRYSSGVGLIA
jgi:hypothetical protein